MPSSSRPCHAHLLGVDFSSAPSAQKPIVVARGELLGAAVRLTGLQRLPSLAHYREGLEALPAPWLGAFDFPFGLPRELVLALGWPQEWLALMRFYAAQPRAALREQFSAFCAARPVGGKFAHRACDKPAGASTSMKWVNPPVAWMMHAGVPPLLDIGAHFPGLHDGDAQRVALEGYPGLLARELIGARSYKADDRARQTPERLIARKDLLDALEQGRTRLKLRLRLSHAQRDALVADAKGDELDAVLCLMQAAWASTQPRYGLPEQFDPLEGWIVSA
jgi:hypothetical protein